MNSWELYIVLSGTDSVRIVAISYMYICIHLSREFNEPCTDHAAVGGSGLRRGSRHFGMIAMVAGQAGMKLLYKVYILLDLAA